MKLSVYRRTALLGLFALLAGPCGLAQKPVAAPEDPRATQFKQLAAQVVEQRRSGAEESEELQEKALKLLDALVLDQLNRTGPPDLAATNQGFAAALARPGAIGESYELVRLSALPGGEVAYALVANFSLSGPSAIRLYTPSAEGYQFAARIDHWEFPDYFDEYAELVPISAADILFVTVNGRTDEQRTGTFAAWHYSDGHFAAVWTTDILEQSSYENLADGFHLAYCSQDDEQNPRVCKRVMRQRYQWDGFAWRRMEQLESDAPKPTPPTKSPPPPKPQP
jgi:hypothetical protein